MYLLDTDIVIYSLKGHGAVKKHLEHSLTKHFARIGGLKLENWAKEEP